MCLSGKEKNCKSDKNQTKHNFKGSCVTITPHKETTDIKNMELEHQMCTNVLKDGVRRLVKNVNYSFNVSLTGVGTILSFMITFNSSCKTGIPAVGRISSSTLLKVFQCKNK